MFSNIFLNKSNLIFNINSLSQIAGKPLCIMVKANAYGHGAREIAEMLIDEDVWLGVSNESEALNLREMTNKKIIVFGRCDDYDICIENDISFAVFSFEHVKEILNTSKTIDKHPQMHLCLNTGMNRYGIREIKELKKVINLLGKKNIELEGFYTHFSSLTSDEEYTKKQYSIFKEFSQLIPDEWKTVKHLGGGRSLFEDFEADMFRVGLGVYGYGNDFVKPVLSVESQIVNILQVKKGQHVGYLCGFTAEKDMKVATIPLGYADGLPRKLSNKLEVEIRGKKVRNIGNICMDAFMVDVSNINCKIGDRVCILENASLMASLLETTEYEVLTNLSKFRGERIIY